MLEEVGMEIKGQAENKTNCKSAAYFPALVTHIVPDSDFYTPLVSAAFINCLSSHVHVDSITR